MKGSQSLDSKCKKGRCGPEAGLVSDGNGGDWWRGVSEETELLLEGRHEGLAPEIDGVVYINEGLLQHGEFVRSRSPMPRYTILWAHRQHKASAYQSVTYLLSLISRPLHRKESPR